MDEVAAAREQLEKKMGKQLGDADDPLLVSVRSGAPFSMPGMMDTVLNLGLNDDSVEGPGQADQQRALRLRLLPPLRADVRQDRARRAGRDVRGGAARPAWRRKGVTIDTELSRRRPRGPRRDVQGDRARREAGVDFPERPAGPAAATRSKRCSSRGTAAGRATTAAWRRSPTTSAPRSTCRRWCSATRATTPAPASRSPATRPPASTSPTATS